MGDESGAATIDFDHRITRREKFAIIFVALLGFVYGLVLTLTIGDDAAGRTEALLGNNILLKVIFAIGLCIISVTVWYVLALTLSRGSTLRRLLTTILMFAVVAVGAGMLIAIVIGLIGIGQLPFHWMLLVGAMNWIVGGIVGLWTIRAAKPRARTA